jgi:hypothetical protein
MLPFVAPLLLLSAFASAQPALSNAPTARKTALTPATVNSVSKASLTAAPSLQEFQAEFQLYRDGKLLGVSTISLAKLGAGFRFSTKSQSEGGMASLVGGASILETSDFLWQQARIVPQRYAYEQRISFKKKQREIRFDWGKQRAREDNGDAVTNFMLVDGALDRHVVVLALAQDLKARAGLTAATEHLVHQVANRGAVETWQFRMAGLEKLQTPLGIVDAEKVERVRTARAGEKPQRETISWHAPQYDFMPVRILQREPDGETLEMRLSSMQITPVRR